MRASLSKFEDLARPDNSCDIQCRLDSTRSTVVEGLINYCCCVGFTRAARYGP